MLLVLVEHAAGKPHDVSLQALTLARSFDAEAQIAALLVGGEGRAAADQLAAHGVSTAYVADLGETSMFAPDAWAAALEGLADRLGAMAVFAAGTERGNEVMARAAARMSLPLASNCVSIAKGQPVVLTRQRWGGSLLEEARLNSERPLVTAAPHAIPIETAMASTPVQVESFTPRLDAKDLLVHVVEHLDAPGGGVSLADAKVVVSGGRGV